MALTFNKHIFRGFVPLIIVSFIIVAIVVVSHGVVLNNILSTINVQPMIGGNSIRTTVSPESLTTNLSCEKIRIPQPMKHKCYHLNWHKSNLTQEVFSRCGFISIQRLRGRTGNQMFQVASLFGTAYDLDLIPVIDPKSQLRKQYNLPNVMGIKLQNVKQCNKESNPRVYTECKLPSGKKFTNMTIIGYRQSWRYFHKIESVVAEIFRKDFKGNSLSNAQSFVKTVSNATYTVVGVHIRRTDMQIRILKHRTDYADVDYFDKAMTYFKIFYRKVRFIIMSDDIQWAKDNLNSSDIFYSPFKSASDDLALMSLCNHMIVTYGTFGWWGAWLANGTTVFFPEKYIEPVKVLPNMGSDYLIPGSMGIR